MDKQQELMLKIKELNSSGLSQEEKSDKLIELARELGKYLLEEKLKR